MFLFYEDSFLKFDFVLLNISEPHPEVQLPQYLDHVVFKAQHDRQLLQWLNNRPEDWSLSWGGATVIYGWGHNHRGQLGGLEGLMNFKC